MTRTVRNACSKRPFKRGAVIVWTAVSITTLLGFAALAVDLGYVTVVHTQLQTAADASAMAGASALASSEKFESSTTQSMLVSLAQSRAEEFAAKNIAAGRALQINSSDVLVGYLANPTDLTETIVTATSQSYNAVRVTINKASANANGPVDLLFARIWGKQNVALSAEATAIIDDRISGFEPKENGGPLIPVTILQQKWTDQITNQQGCDDYGYNADTGQITKSPDGAVEISIYPERSGAGGNFGLLNFENGNSSVNPVADQVRNGITAEEMERTIGSPEITFTNENGQSVAYSIDGTPGLKASLKDDFESRIGTVVGFFIHDTLPVGDGANAVYHIVGIRFGRLMYSKLTGSPNSKVVIIQPTVYTGPELRTRPNAPRNETAGKIKLVR